MLLDIYNQDNQPQILSHIKTSSLVRINSKAIKTIIHWYLQYKLYVRGWAKSLGMYLADFQVKNFLLGCLQYKTSTN